MVRVLDDGIVETFGDDPAGKVEVFELHTHLPVSICTGVLVSKYFCTKASPFVL
jgi:hypothetical protein